MTDEQPTEPILPDSLSPERAVELGNVESVVEPAKKKRGRPPRFRLKLKLLPRKAPGNPVRTS